MTVTPVDHELYIESLEKLKRYGDIDPATYQKVLEFAKFHQPKKGGKVPAKPQSQRKANQEKADEVQRLKHMYAENARVLKEVHEKHRNTELELAAMKEKVRVLTDLVELFRDGHSDSESFSQACEKYDEVLRGDTLHP